MFDFIALTLAVVIGWTSGFVLGIAVGHHEEARHQHIWGLEWPSDDDPMTEISERSR